MQKIPFVAKGYPTGGVVIPCVAAISIIFQNLSKSTLITMIRCDQHRLNLTDNHHGTCDRHQSYDRARTTTAGAEGGRAGSAVERSQGWIVKQALAAWVDQEEERSRLTREAMADVDAGRFIDHEAVLAWSSSLSTDNPLASPQIAPSKF